MADEPTPAERQQRLEAAKKAREENDAAWKNLTDKQKASDARKSNGNGGKHRRDK